MLALGLVCLAGIALLGITHTVSFGHAGGSVSLSAQVQKTGEVAAEAEIALAEGAVTDQEEAVAFDHTTLQEIYIQCDDAACTIETNSGSAADDTLSIAAGVPFVWVAGAGITNPFSAAVTSIFITKAGGTDAATLYIRTLNT